MSKTNRCLICYDPVEDGLEYHPKCSRRLFEISKAPKVEFGLAEIEEIAKGIAHSRLLVTGVQPKLSVELKKERGADTPKLTRVTFAGLWGKYILKPPHPEYPGMPENEDLTMHLAEVCGIRTALHGLIRLKSGELAYLAKRFDRIDGSKLAMEDACQLSELLTEDKYHSSMEKCGKVLLRYSSNPGNDAVSFLEIALFSFLVGNADMHLKNFSLLTTDDGMTGLSPAYDLLATKLLTTRDPEEMALTVNGKKSRLKSSDFLALANSLNIPEKAIQRTWQRIESAISAMKRVIEISFLSDRSKVDYRDLLEVRSRQLFSNTPKVR